MTAPGRRPTDLGATSRAGSRPPRPARPAGVRAAPDRPTSQSRSRAPKGDLEILLHLASLGALTAPVVRTSREIGDAVGLSQQSADRHLVGLAGRGLVTRQMAMRRQRLRLTEPAADLLRGEYGRYRRIFEGPARVRFSGEVRSGLGEGRYYLSQPGYVRQFKRRLHYTPFPGTLNIGVPSASLASVTMVRAYQGIRIDGFEASGRTFGGATCLGATISGHACHAIVPDRTHHTDVIELIAPARLRDLLHLADGDRVDVEIREA